jgi:hypothetical protein
MEFHLDDVIGDGEGALCRRLIAKKSVDQDVRRCEQRAPMR